MKNKWVVQSVFWLAIGGISFGFSSNLLPTFLAIKVALLNLSFFMSAFYINVLVIFPKTYQTNNNRNFIIALFGFTVLYSLLQVEMEYQWINSMSYRRIPAMRPRVIMFVRTFFWLALMALLSTVYLIQQRLRDSIEYNRKISEGKLHAELKLLKAQMNPHFLFNALNNIYSLAYLKSDKAPESILELSNMLRYVIEDGNKESVPLRSEVEYLQNYIAFQRIKTPDNMQVEFEFLLNPELTIAPMLFSPFVENSFKYSKIEEFPNASIKLLLTASEKQIVFTIINSIPPVAKANRGSGTGINNVRQRLLLIYPQKHQLTINETKTAFEVRLVIDCN